MSTEAATPLPECDFLHVKLALAAAQSSPQTSPRYRLIFRINLHNTSPVSVRLLGRKWILRERGAPTRIIEAGQIFNEKPILEPGSIFSLSGCHEFCAPPTGVELRLFGVDQAHAPFITPALNFPRRALSVH